MIDGDSRSRDTLLFALIRVAMGTGAGWVAWAKERSNLTRALTLREEGVGRVLAESLHTFVVSNRSNR